MIIILFGVTGVGKTTVGKLLAKDLDWRFYDADDYHSAANIEKMKAGIPLDDADREGWLQSLHDLITESLDKSENAVLACSALKSSYRDRLRVNENVKFVLLQADFATIERRLSGRKGHFMNPHLLQSQFDALEIPDDTDTVIDASKSLAILVAEIKKLVE